MQPFHKSDLHMNRNVPSFCSLLFIAMITLLASCEKTELTPTIVGTWTETNDKIYSEEGESVLRAILDYEAQTQTYYDAEGNITTTEDFLYAVTYTFEEDGKYVFVTKIDGKEASVDTGIYELIDKDNQKYLKFTYDDGSESEIQVTTLTKKALVIEYPAKLTTPDGKVYHYRYVLTFKR